uniref:Transcription factor GTE10-like n=1 Tax=Cicer arietinum TaxID=3827 RepID=A0A1S2Y7M3_CICAR|nr:transcription factor GTE10-like [Cicer arietinum]
MAPTVPIDFAGQKESRKCSHSQIMGKSRKYSKGYSSGFVPEYRHVVETMGESDGLGSSGRVDMEPTASADSYAPKRKGPGLKGDGYGSFDVPFQLFSLSKMSAMERKDLKLRLTWELEQVRKLQKKIDSMNSNTVGLSPSSDIRSCSVGQKRPHLESQHSILQASVPHGKKRPSQGRNGPKTKKSTPGRLDYLKPAASMASYATLMKQCETLLNRLMTHQFGWVFSEPVDAVKLNIPDYFTVIKHPMDLGTVRDRLTSGKYSNPMDFAADVRLTFSNAMTYNPPGNDVHTITETLSKAFETRWKAIEKKIPVTDHRVPYEPSKPTFVETEILDPIPPTKKKKVTPNVTNTKPQPIERIMSDMEKQKLSQELEDMLGELPETILDFLKEQSHNAGQTNDDEIEIDIDTLSDDTLFKLRKLLDDYMLEMEKQRFHPKAGQCEMEIPNESGFSNSSMQPSKGNELVDEDVDIVGGNDPPISNYPPLEIEKDGTNRNSKCSSSSSSSSESGSSSSDSDSSSSSGSELDTAKASEPLSTKKENVGPGLTCDQNRGDLSNPEAGKDSTDLGTQVDQSLETKAVTIESESHQDGESAASKRQVSPEKLYRAALLRSRFADTILKAQEKALEKDEKRDPEKLRIEREGLERRQKEEKARLQAEAKAAEEARRKAEAEAAAETKRKREEEREAARQALQKMEKTVEINESCQFLEDLEMLSAVHDENAPIFKEASPDHHQNGFGGIKLQGNPLEQLGLYMKVDDEDEEEELPQSAAGPSKDVEEGEID